MSEVGKVAPKITIIGAGSLVFTPHILADIAMSKDLKGVDICLMDIDEERLNLMAKLSNRIISERKADMTVSQSTDRTEALEKADYVVVSISVGTDIEKRDIDIPAKYGYFAPVGDTTGPQGFPRALRHIPVMIDIAKDIQRICPEAFVLNVTNPMTALCTAVRRNSSVNFVGLCVGIYGTKGFLARILNEKPEDINLLAGGINHFTWIKEILIRGRSGYDQLRKNLDDIIKSQDKDEIIRKCRGHYISFLLFDKFGLFPSPGDSHVAEFLPYFLTAEAERGASYGLSLYPKGTIYDPKWREQAWSNLVKWATGKSHIDELFRETFTEETLVIRVLESLISKRNDFYEAVNVPNAGAIPGLPDDTVVEVPAVVGNVGVKPVHIGPLPEAIEAILRQQLSHIDLTVEAALTGDRKIALQALLIHPSVRTLEDAEKMLEDFIKHEAKYLPKFK